MTERIAALVRDARQRELMPCPHGATTFRCRECDDANDAQLGVDVTRLVRATHPWLRAALAAARTKCEEILRGVAMVEPKMGANSCPTLVEEMVEGYDAPAIRRCNRPLPCTVHGYRRM